MAAHPYCQVTISATSKAEANRISDTLVKKKLLPGTLIIHGPSRYWWKGKIVEKVYYNVKGFTLLKHKPGIIREVRKIHSDKCPILAFAPIDGNKEFLAWIRESL